MRAALERLYAMSAEERARMDYGRHAERNAIREWNEMPADAKKAAGELWEREQKRDPLGFRHP